jgi:nitrous oxide reductase
MNQERKTTVRRREFLRTFGIGTAAIAVGGALASDAHADTETADEKTKVRYKADSPHLQKFYSVNRYPAK